MLTGGYDFGNQISGTINRCKYLNVINQQILLIKNVSVTYGNSATIAARVGVMNGHDQKAADVAGNYHPDYGVQISPSFSLMFVYTRRN